MAPPSPTLPVAVPPEAATTLEVPTPVTLRERIHTEITAAMRSGATLRRDTLRMAESSIYNGEKRDRRTYTDDEVAAVLSREVKTRRESVEAFRKGAREDLAGKEEAEIAILTEFLPAQLTEAEIRALIDQAVGETGATSPRDLGKVMGWLAPRTRGRADGKLVSGLVGARLAAGGPDAVGAGSGVGAALAPDPAARPEPGS